MDLLTPTKFAVEIENIVNKYDITYMDAVLQYCSENELEPEFVSGVITQPLKEKIALEAQKLNFLPKTATLPL